MDHLLDKILSTLGKITAILFLMHAVFFLLCSSYTAVNERVFLQEKKKLEKKESDNG